jgi:hypothetical protein
VIRSKARKEPSPAPFRTTGALDHRILSCIGRERTEGRKQCLIDAGHDGIVTFRFVTDERNRFDAGTSAVAGSKRRSP